MKNLRLTLIAILGLLTFTSCSDDDDNNSLKPTEEATIVVEVTTFNLNSDADPNAFEVRDTEIEADFASQQPGFLKRMSGVDANGKYVVMVFWETLADADASIAAFGADPTVADYFGMIDGSTFSAERFTTFEVPDINFSLASNNVIEVTTFNLNAGVDANAFNERDAEIEQDFSSQQAGFIRRTSGVDADGKYAVIVFWETLADADASITAFQSDPTVADYFAMIDGNTFNAERFTIFNPPLTGVVALPPRCDSRPETTMGVPHHQIGVEPVADVNEELFRRVYSLPGIKNQPSVIGQWRGLWLTDEVTIVVPEALINGSREFGHIHDDGSLHIFLEPSRAVEAVAACWGIDHPFAVQQRQGWDGFVMLYTPQSINELNVTFQLIVDGYNNVTGQNLLAADYY